MEKIICLLLALALITAVFTACYGDNDTEAESTAAPVSTASDTVTEQKTETEENKTSETESANTTAADTETQTSAFQPDYSGVYYGENGIKMTVNADGTGTFTEDGVAYDATWMLNDGTFVIWDYADHAFSGQLVDARLSGMWQHEIPMVFSADPSVITEKTYPEPPYSPSEFKPVTVDLYGGLEITVLGAELFRDSEHGEAIRIYYDAKNTTDEYIKVSDFYSTFLTRDIYDYAHCTNHNSDEADAYEAAIAPEETVRCAAEFVCVWEYTDPYVFEIMNDDYKLAKMFGATDELEPGEYYIQTEFYMDKMPAFPSGGLPAKP